MMKQLAIVLVLVHFCFAGVACGGKKAGIEGKIVDGKENPLAGVKLIAKQVQPIKGYDSFEAVSGADGTFKFKGVFPSSEYIIEPSSDAWKTSTKVKVQSAPEGQTRMLDKPFVVRYTLSKSGVVTDSKAGLQWVPSNGQVMNHDQAETYIRNLNLEGGGWRFPVVSDLKQIAPVLPMLRDTSAYYTIWSNEICDVYGRPGVLISSVISGSELGGGFCHLPGESHTCYVIAVRSQIK